MADSVKETTTEGAKVTTIVTESVAVAPLPAEPIAAEAPAPVEPAAAVTSTPLSTEEKQTQLNATVEGLGTGKFNLGEATVPVASIIANPEKYVLLDVRTVEEMAVGIIPGAITKASFEAEPEKYADKEVVAYCTVGYVSGACTYELRKKGHENVKNMGDGALLGYTLAQTSAGVEKPLVNPAGEPTNEVHTFMPALAALAGEGMVGKAFEDPPAVLEAANASVKERTGL
mmetsp:Transcript_70143/g.137889  ORF Transcript_70143/g.137889 Transcript_70143/m.137889 type:complete len:230 (-) Transcript_70143:304-993(-)